MTEELIGQVGDFTLWDGRIVACEVTGIDYGSGEFVGVDLLRIDYNHPEHGLVQGAYIPMTQFVPQ